MFLLKMSLWRKQYDSHSSIHQKRQIFLIFYYFKVTMLQSRWDVELLMLTEEREKENRSSIFLDINDTEVLTNFFVLLFVLFLLFLSILSKFSRWTRKLFR